jgi:hypothetical protein
MIGLTRELPSGVAGLVGGATIGGGAAALANALTPKESFNGENSIDNEDKWKMF